MNKFLLLIFFVLSLNIFADTLVVSDTLLDTTTLHDVATDSAIVDSSAIPKTIDDTNASIKTTDTVISEESDEYNSLFNQFQDTLQKEKTDTLKSIHGISKFLYSKSISLFKIFIVLLFIGIVIIFVIRFFRKRIEKNRFLTSTRLSLMDTEVQIACKYMERNYSDPDMTLETICMALTTGPAFLEALFQKELGMGVSQFLIQVRVNRARILISEKGIVSPEEIYYRVGYTDLQEFLNDFHLITGLTFDEFKGLN